MLNFALLGKQVMSTLLQNKLHLKWDLTGICSLP